MSPHTVQVHSDIACPWCWVGKRHLELALERVDVEVAIEWRPFELDPRQRPTPDSVDYVERLSTKYGTSREQAAGFIERMVGAGRAVGLEIRFDAIRPANTFDAHRLLRWARDEGRQGELSERLFRAYMNEGRDVNDAATLVELARDVGLDPARAEALLVGDEYRDAVARELAEARARGIQGVPHFTFPGGLTLSGAQPPQVLADALSAATSREP